MYRENPGFPWLVVVPILFALFSAFLVKPIQSPSRSSPSEKRESSKAALASNVQVQLSQNATPSSLSSPVATPTGQPRPAPERNPGLVIGGGMIALIIILGLLRFSSHPKPTGP